MGAIEVELDTCTGISKILGAYGSFDVGTPIDYNIVIGQMEGEWGACSVLMDGVLVNSCCMAMGAANGSSITTMEGFRETEYAVLNRAFGAVSDVQCGFCIPGMILSAKSLLDGNLNPTRADVKLAIKGNLCRCTGYKKMEDVTLLAADFFREKREIPPAPSMLHMDKHAKRIDAAEKLNGTGLFIDDLTDPGMLYAKPVHSKFPRTLISRIEVSRALAHPDCVEVLLKQDVPCNKIGHIKQDWDVILGEGDITRYVGNVLAVVATDKQELLKELCALVEADYTEFKPVTSPFEALWGDAPMIHEDGNVMSRANIWFGATRARPSKAPNTWSRGNIRPPGRRTALWSRNAVWPCPRATTACCSIPRQSVYDVQRESAKMLGLPRKQVHCHAAGPYNYQNIDIFGMSVYANNVVSGAFRGFGVT